MTGAFIRIERGGKWQNIEIDQMTNAELDILATGQPGRGWKWAIFLAKWIRDNIGPMQRGEGT